MRASSHEVRWFFPGPPPPAVERWFRRPGPWPRAGRIAPLAWPEPRADRYLRLAEDLGIKQRGAGRTLDVKGRVCSLGQVVLGPDRVGAVERWTKWSYEEGAVPPGLAALLAGQEGMVEVRKARLQRRIRLAGRGEDEEVPLDAPVDRAVSLELAAIEVAEGAAWSVGFEAFPPDPDLHADFARAVGRALDGFPGSLPAAASMGYPAWLARGPAVAPPVRPC